MQTNVKEKTMKETGIKNKANNKNTKYTVFVLVSFAVVFALNILNSTAFNMLLQSVATDVRFSSTLLPHAIYYFMSVLAIVWQFLAVALIVDTFTRKNRVLTSASCVLFFCAMMAGSMLPIIVAAIQYSSQTIITLLQSNEAAVLTDAFFAVLRVLLIVGVCFAVTFILRKKQKNRLSAALASCLCGSVVLVLLSMLVIFIPNTLPFLQSAGQNALRSQLFKIIMEYVLLAVYGVIGYAVAAFTVRFSYKKY